MGFDASEDREISNLKFLRSRCNYIVHMYIRTSEGKEVTIPNWLTYVANVAKLAPFRETFFKMESDDSSL